MKTEIDVVIPSYRLVEDILLPIFALSKPPETTVTFFLVADNPAIPVPPAIRKKAEAGEITLIENKKNLGFSQTRNIGIHAGKAQWILLLDDDIVPDNKLLYEYQAAFVQHPEAVGFIGVTEFPKPF